MNELLKVENLSVDFAVAAGTVHAVRNVSFTVYEGETLAMVGESGCGKSVTARAVMRLLGRSSAEIAPESAVVYKGTNLLSLSRRELNRVRGKEIGMVFQDAMTSLNPTMTVGGQLSETVRAHSKAGRTEAAAKAAELLSMVELSNARELLRRYPHELSGGQRQRVMIAMALSCGPKLLIADEPTTALDVTVQAQILGLIRDLQKKLGMSVLLITHDLGIVAGAADRVQVMYAGQIVERGSARQILTAPKHPYSAALLAAVPRRNLERGSELYALPGTPPDLRLELKGCPFAARCRYAMPVCRRMMPEERDNCRCWLRHPMAPHVNLSERGRK